MPQAKQLCSALITEHSEEFIPGKQLQSIPLCSSIFRVVSSNPQTGKGHSQAEMKDCMSPFRPRLMALHAALLPGNLLLRLLSCLSKKILIKALQHFNKIVFLSVILVGGVGWGRREWLLSICIYVRRM